MRTATSPRLKICLFSTLLLFFTVQLFAQSNYLPATITTKDGISKEGFVDYGNWSKNPKNINFKTNLEGDGKKYSALEIESFQVNGEHYLGAVVDIELSPYSRDLMDYNSSVILKKDTIFLQALVLGEQSLFHVKNRIGKDNFYLYSSDKELILLKYKKYYKEVKGIQNVVQELMEYKSQLNTYLNKCGSIGQSIGKTAYKKKALTSLFLEYSECVSVEPDFVKKKEKIKMKFGVVAGISATTIYFRSNNFKVLTSTDFPYSIAPAGGVSLDLIFPRAQGKWSNYNELFFNTYNLSAENYEEPNENESSYSKVELGFSYIKLNTMIRYKQPVGAMDIYANIGLSQGIIVGNKNRKLTENTFFGSVNRTEEKALNELRIYELGYLAGLGFKYQKFGLEFRYERGNGASPFLGLASLTNRYYGLLSYEF